MNDDGPPPSANDPNYNNTWVETMLRTILKTTFFGAVLLSFAGAHGALAQSDNRPIRIIIGFGPSSTADVAARVLGHQMEQDLGVPVIVENRPGNSSMLAAEHVARASNDGKTLFMATVANTLYPARDNSGFDLATKLQPVALVGSVPNVLVANPSIKPKSFADLVTAAKATPRAFTFGTSGQWTAAHMGVEMFNLQAGTKIVSVPYQGSNQTLTDVLGGQINLMWGAAITVAPYVNDGKLIALAVGQSKRTDFLANVPSMPELGMPDFDISIWMGLLAPPGTAANVVDRLSDAVLTALAKEPVQAAFKRQGIEAQGMDAAAFKKFVQADSDKWKRILEQTGLTKAAN